MYALLMTGAIVNYSFQLCFFAFIKLSPKDNFPRTKPPFKVCVLGLGEGGHGELGGKEGHSKYLAYSWYCIEHAYISFHF